MTKKTAMLFKNFLLVIALANFKIAVAQNNFVEITVADTAIVSANEFLLNVYFNSEKYTEPTDTIDYKDPNIYIKRQARLEIKRKEFDLLIREKLSQAGFYPVIASINELLDEDYKETMRFYVHNIESLKAFNNIIRQTSMAHASLYYVKSDKEEHEYNRLYKKLIEKALKRAKFIAAMEGKEIGTIMSVTDSRNNFFGWNYYNNPTGTLKYNTIEINGISVIGSYQIQNTITVRYSWR